MAIELSAETTRRLEALFLGTDREAVASLLVEQCGNNLPFCERSTPVELERIRFAVLKLSEGDVAKLLEAIGLAQVDWRDVLVAAGFAEHPTVHAAWWPPPASGR